MASTRVSAKIQGLIDKGLFDRLPRTFTGYCFEQLGGWQTLFPAEQTYYESLFSLFDRSDSAQVDRLFAPMRDIERRMGVNDKTWPKRQFTLDQVDLLNRNPLYPEWRGAVSQVFARVDPLLNSEIERRGHTRLVLVIAPPQLPVGPDRMWSRIERHGRRIAIEAPADPAEYLPLVLRGGPDGKSIADLSAGRAYDSWVIETGESIHSSLGDAPGCVGLSYSGLDSYRKRLMREVNNLVRSKGLRGPRQLGAHLKNLRIVAPEAALANDAILAEFTRATLLNGNGTLLVNNTFVEWAAVQAIRRARPSVMILGFGIRNKIKPFSSLLIYADQDAVNQVPTQMDSLGSYVDLEIFCQYIWQEFEKYAEYRSNTAYLFLAEGMDQMLLITPPDFPIRTPDKALSLPALYHAAREWMGK
jgi:hypothetical protein